MVTLNATVFPDQAYVLVQVDWTEPFFQDTFTRTLVDSWGTPDIGPAYVVAAGAAANFDVNGIMGTTTHTAVNTSNFITSAVNAANINFTGQFTNTVTPAGDNLQISIFGRFADLNNYVRVIVLLNNPAGQVSSVIEQVEGGVATSSSLLTIPGLPASGVYRFRLIENGSSIQFRLWLAGTPEPAIWHNTFTATRLVAGGVGVGSKVNPGITNPLPISFSWDDLEASDPNNVCPIYAGVTRTNTVTGETVNLRPYLAFDADGNLLLDCCEGLWWDTEPPLNVPLEYCAVSGDVATTVSVNPDFDGSAAGWTTANGATLTQDCTVAKVGTCSGRITPNGTTTNPTIFQAVPLLAGREVTASGWVMSPQGWNSVLLRLVVVYADLSSETLETEYMTLDDNEWRFLSLTFTPAQAITSATFSFIAAGLPPNTTLFNVDDLKLTQLTDVTATSCETVTVTSESVWLKSPLHPCDDMEIGLCSPMMEDCDEDSRVSYVGTFDDSYAANTVLLSPVNRRRPIPINRIRRDAAATLRLLAHDCDAKDAVLQANEPGDPLLFQAPADYCIPDRYISVETLSEGRISVDQRQDFRLMTLPYVTVDRPEGPMDGPCGARFQDLCDIYSSWAALEIAGLTWEDLLLGEASPNGPGQPEPPAGARTWGDVEAEFTNWLAVEAGGTRDWGELRDGL